MDCVFEENCAGSGGGLVCGPDSRVLLSACSFRRNFATHGGGIALGGDSTFLVVESSSLIGNWAYKGGFGGALSCGLRGHARLLNCLVTGNLAEWEGGVYSDGIVEVVNSTITGNLSAQQGPGIYCGHKNDLGSAVVFNSIVWGNNWGPLCGEYTASIFDRDPMFVRPGVYDFERFTVVELAGRQCMFPDFIVEPGDYRLARGSPAIDAGQTEGAAAYDLDGKGRPCGAGVDIGAYEAGDCPLPEPVLFARGDANGDGQIELSDAILALGFLFLGGESPDCHKSADADDSGTLEVTDPVYVLGYLFLGSAAPASPFPDCGGDPTLDGLPCEAQTACLEP
jgi:hypothetical protein